jgi:hypothetical protein
MGVVQTTVPVFDQQGGLRQPNFQELASLIARAPGLTCFSPDAQKWCSAQFEELYPLARKAGLMPLIRSSLEPSYVSDTVPPSFRGPDTVWIEFRVGGRPFIFGPSVRGFVDELENGIGQSHYQYSRVTVADYLGMLTAQGVRSPEIIANDNGPRPFKELGWMAYLAACSMVDNGTRVLAELEKLKAIPADERALVNLRDHQGWKLAVEWFSDLVNLSCLTCEVRKFPAPVRVMGHDVRSVAARAKSWSEYVSEQWADPSDAQKCSINLSRVESGACELLAWGRALGLLVHAEDLHPGIKQRFREPIAFETLRAAVGTGDHIKFLQEAPVHPGVFYVIAQCARNAVEHGAHSVEIGWKTVGESTYVWISDTGSGLRDSDGKPLTSEDLGIIFGNYTTKDVERQGGFGLFGCALMARRCKGLIAVRSLAGGESEDRSEATYPKSGVRFEAYQSIISQGMPERGTVFIYCMKGAANHF